MGHGLSSKLGMHQFQPPPRYQAQSLFAIDSSNPEVHDFQELVCCPSRHGAHIISYKDYQLLYKIKIAMTIHEEFTRFSVYEVDGRGIAARIPVGSMDKARTVISAAKGSYCMLQAWHLSATKLEMKKRTGIQNKRRAIHQPTPSETTAVNVHFKVSGSRDFTRGRAAERWDMSFDFSDPEYTMMIEGNGHMRSTQMRSVRIYHRDQLVCTAHKQGFEHMKRPSYERPYLGLQVRGAVKRKLQQPAPRGFSLVRKPADTVDPVMAHEDLLPILCAVAWGEEVVKPPVDLRAKFMARMRSTTENIGTVSTDCGWDSLSDVPKATDHPKDHIMHETPAAPAGSVRSQRHLVPKNHSGTISLMGV